MTNTLISTAFLTCLILSTSAHCQNLAPIDISGFGKDRPIRATAASVSTSECRGGSYIQNREKHEDGSLYSEDLSVQMDFTNVSPRPVLLYRKLEAMTERVAASPEGIAQGTFLAGYDGDRIAASGEMQQPSFDDFVLLKSGEVYKETIRVKVFASSGDARSLHTPGNYWVQLGIDARPDSFYYVGGAEAKFKQQWDSRGKLVDFVLAEPFAVEVKLDPNSQACK